MNKEQVIQNLIVTLCNKYSNVDFLELRPEYANLNEIDIKTADTLFITKSNQIKDFFYKAKVPTEKYLAPKNLIIFYQFNKEFRKKIDAGYTPEVANNLNKILFEKEIASNKELGLLGAFLQEKTVNALLSVKNVGTRKKIIELSSILNQETNDVYKIPFKIAQVYKDRKLAVEINDKSTYKYKKIDYNFAKSLSYLKLKLKKIEKEDEYMKKKVISHIRGLALDYHLSLSPLFFEGNSRQSLDLLFKDLFGGFKDYDKTNTIKEKFDNAIEKLNTKIENTIIEKEKEKQIKKINKEINNIIAQLKIKNK